MTFFLVFNISWGPPILNLPRASGMLRPALSLSHPLEHNDILAIKWINIKAETNSTNIHYSFVKEYLYLLRYSFI